MLLAIDTATQRASLALDDGVEILAEHNWLCVNNHTMELAPQVEHMLRTAGVRADALEALAVALGPGSFTGLRIGLAFAKGLALANALPLLGVPTLDIVAYAQPKRDGSLLAVLSAGRGRIAVGAYRWNEVGWQADGPARITYWDGVLRGLGSENVSVCGEIDAAARDILGEQVSFAPAPLNVRRAACLIAIARQRLVSGQTDDPNALTPLYLSAPEGGEQPARNRGMLRSSSSHSLIRR
jgi:tRNA threonylcarbamoyladenosine biosynthesis protein TsaB